MEKNYEIDFNLLLQRPYLTSFFSDNIEFLKNLSKKQSKESDFLKNYEKEQSFVNKVSIEKAKEQNKNNIISIMGAFNTKAQSPYYKKNKINSDFYLSAYNSKDKKTYKDYLPNNKNTSLISTLKKIYTVIKRNNDYEKYRKNITLKTANFFRKNNKILKGLDEEDIFALKNNKIKNKENLIDYIAKKARKKISGKTPIKFNELALNEISSLFIILNVGNIANIFKSSEQAYKIFSGGKTIAKESLKEEIVDTLFSKLKYKTDKDTFLKNIIAAAYLLDNASKRTETQESQEDFDNFINELESQLDDYLDYISSKAEKLLDRNKFTETFLKSNSEFASIVVGSEHINAKNSLSEYINANPGLTEEEFDINDLIFKYQLNRLRPDNFSEQLFSKNTGLANMLLKYPSFRENLSNADKKLSEFFSKLSKDLSKEELETAIEAYLSDYDKREKTKS